MKELTFVMRMMMKEKKDIVLSIVLGFIAGMAAVLLFSASGYLISKAAFAPPFYTLMLVIASVKLLSFVRAFSRYGERYVSHRGTFTMLSQLRLVFYEKLEPLAPGIFHKYRSGDLLARIVGDVESLQNFFLRVVYPPVVLLLVFMSTVFFTTFYSFQIAAILLMGFLLTTIVVPAIFAVRQRAIDSEVRIKRARLSTEVTEFLYGFRDLKIYQQLDNKEQQLLQASDSYIKEQGREERTTLFNQSLNQFLSLLVTVAVLAAGTYLIGTGELDGIFLAMLIMITLTVFEEVPAMAVFPIHFNDSRRAAKRLFSIIDHKEKPVHKEVLVLNKAPEIRVEDVTFTFQTEERPAVEGVSVYLPSGSKTAFVGASGSGKSTLMQLMLQLITPDQGKITINGAELTTVHQKSIWQAANVVLQENHFFYGTIRDNLLLANDTVVDAELQDALRKVQLEQFHLDDLVYERGENLSGGEKQRLAIARAMLKGGKLWFLDEPTSSLDAVTEQMVYEHLFRLAADDTLVLISHRLTGLEKMDQIIVMDEGKIVETGTFATLMEKQGYFYEMKKLENNLL